METNTNDGYLAFMPDWREYKDLLTCEEWCELEDYIFKLRFDNIDTDPSTIKNKHIQVYWKIIRKGVQRALAQFRYRKNKTKNTDIPSNTEFDKAPKKKNENKGDFRPKIPKDDIRVQQDIESVPNLLKTGKNEELHIPSDVIDEMGHYANDDSMPINERYSNISRLFKPYSRNIPSHKINDYINSIYNKLREVA